MHTEFGIFEKNITRKLYAAWYRLDCVEGGNPLNEKTQRSSALNQLCKSTESDLPELLDSCPGLIESAALRREDCHR